MKWKLTLFFFLFTLSLWELSDTSLAVNYTRSPSGNVDEPYFIYNANFDSSELPGGCSGRTYWSLGGYLTGAQSTRQFVATDSWRTIQAGYNSATTSFDKNNIFGVDGAMPNSPTVWEPQATDIFCTNGDHSWIGADVAFSLEGTGGAKIFGITDIPAPTTSSATLTAIIMSTTTDLAVNNFFSVLSIALPVFLFFLVVYLIFKKY